MRQILAVLAGCLVLQACGGDNDAVNDSAAAGPTAGGDSAARADSARRASSATVPMRSAAGRELGTLTLTESGGGIAISGRIAGLTPGEHGIHIHMVGQCQPPFESAGAHWNPTNRQHGSQNPQGPHLGDMPNITVGADSSANVQVNTAGGTLRGADALLDTDGAAVVVHARADDLRTDPSGNSGDRIACGVITAG
jgi:Cu-Zn family superoxide dismutase